MESIEELKFKVEQYEKDPEKRGYFSLVRIINEQVDFLNSFNIRNNIGGKPSEDGTFVRTQNMWEKLPQLIKEVRELKKVLKISQQDDEDNQAFVDTIAEKRK